MNQNNTFNISLKDQPSLISTMLKLVFTKKPKLKFNTAFPNFVVEFENYKIDNKNLSIYKKICRVKDSIQVPIFYPHIMSAKIHFYIFAHKDFPINLIGAIHKYNTVELYKPLNIDDVYTIEARIIAQRYFSKGVEFDLETTLKVKNEIVWKEVSTYLKKQHFDIELSLENNFINPIKDLTLIAKWWLEKDTARKYAFISKDFNPIHLHKNLAKIFGFKKDLAHGMCTVAQALSELDLDFQNKIIKIYFKGPCFLNNELQLFQDQTLKNRYDLKCGNNDRAVISIEII